MMISMYQCCSMLMMGCWPAAGPLARSCGEDEDMIQMVIEVAGECVLNINKGKSNVLLFNHDGIRLERLGE